MARGLKTGGRQKGTTNKVTGKRREIAARALKQGITPLELMLKNMRRVDAMADAAEKAAITFVREAVEKMSPEDLLVAMLAEAKKVIGLREFAQECARDAAPFMHPRLAAVAMTDDKKAPLFQKIERLIVHPVTNPSDTDAGSLRSAA